ncbi:diguanylate cyclase [Novosphingobium sp.]|uniref:diguanylate cyclase n=1 Tax=Novosphingobium sp. TaxID=1874826 RepID=UPI0035AE4638
MKFLKSQIFAATLAILCLAQPAQAREVRVAYESAHDAEIDRGIAQLQSGDPKGATQSFGAIIAAYEKDYPSGPDYRCSVSAKHADYLAGQLANAPGTSDIVILGPNWCLALWGYGFALIDLNRSADAEVYLAKSVAMAPYDAHYRNEYAELFKNRRDWQRSYLEFSLAWEVVSHDPKGPDRSVAARSLRGMGFNKIELGDLDEAERLFKQSLEFDPDSPAAANELRYIARLRAAGGGN